MLKKLFLFSLFSILSFSSVSFATEKTLVEIISLPFGSSQYVMDMAIESLFNELDSPYKIQLKQGPGATFSMRYLKENEQKMKDGKASHAFAASWDAITPFTTEGRPPFQQFPLPDGKNFFSSGTSVLIFVSFDQSIKGLEDFKGKKVGFAEKARPFQSNLPQQPLFDKAYGGFDKVNWQYLGFANSKDALLNGSIDIHVGSLQGKTEVDENGNFVLVAATPDPALLEVLSAGKPINFINEDPEKVKISYDPATDLVQTPILIKAGTLVGQTKDFWAKGMFSTYSGLDCMPDEMVGEIVYQIFSNKARLAEYYDGFKYLPDNPYPVTLAPKFIHPGIHIALKKLGLEVPANAVK